MLWELRVDGHAEGSGAVTAACQVKVRGSTVSSIIMSFLRFKRSPLLGTESSGLGRAILFTLVPGDLLCIRQWACGGGGAQ